MKKGILIIALIAGALTLTAIGLTQTKEVQLEKNIKQEPKIESIVQVADTKTQPPILINNFFVDIGPRFIATVTKEALDKARSISDIIPKDANWDMHTIVKAHVRVYNEEHPQKPIASYNLNLSKEQLELLKSTQYSEDLQFGANLPTSVNSFNYMVSIIPEKQAAYKAGKEELIQYLQNSVFSSVSLEGKEQWNAGKIKFTVNTNGKISDVKLSSSSGSDAIDQQMTNLLQHLPTDWRPAENSNGEPVEQTLTLSFGSMGC